MWKCVAALLFLGQCIIITAELAATEDKITRYNRDTENCCPCPDVTHKNDNDQDSSVPLQSVLDCPCKSRSADSDAASSIFSPVYSMTPHTRETQKKEPKPLLEPEVDLASSVLETLREATEEEYQDALARDAARNANQHESLNNLVGIVFNPETQEDDILPEASNNHDITCTVPFLKKSDDIDSLGENSAHYPNNIVKPLIFGRTPAIQRSQDVNEAGIKLHRGLAIPYRNVIIPHTLLSRNPLGSILDSTPLNDRDLPVWPSDILGRYIIESTENLLPIKSLPLSSSSLFSPRKPQALSHLINLRPWNIFPPKKIAFNRAEDIKPLSLHPLTDAVGAFSENYKAEDFNTKKDGITDGNTDNNLIVENVETKILNILPPQRESNLSGSFNEPDLEEANDSAISKYFVKDAINNFSDKSFHSDTNEDGVVEESKKNVNEISPSQNCDLCDQCVLSSRSLDDIQGRVSIPQNNGDISVSQETDLTSMKNNILQTLGNFKQANAIIHDNLKSNLVNVLQIRQDKSSNNCGDLAENTLSMKDLQEMSNNILLNNDKESIITPKTTNAYATYESTAQNEDLLRLPSKQSEIRMGNSNIWENENDFAPYDIAKGKSDNFETCLKRDDIENKNSNARNKNTEMNMAATDSFNARSGILKIPQGYGRSNENNIYSTTSILKPLEDINLDIFEYKSPFFDQNDGIKSKSISLPRLNMKSYKTKLPIPKSLDLKPVKFEKAVRKGNDVLGAILTMHPHTEKSSNKMRTSQSRYDDVSSDPFEILPNIDDINSFLANSVKNILKFPNLSDNSGSKYASPLALNIDDASDILRTYTEDSLRNVQQSVGNTFNNVRDGDHTTLGDTLLNPNGLIGSISRSNIDVNKNLRALNSDFNDRLNIFRQNVFDESKSPTYFVQKQKSSFNLNPKSTNRESGILRPNLNSVSKLSENKKSPILRLSHGRGSNSLYSKPSLYSPKSSDNLNLRIKPPANKIDRPKYFDNARLSPKLEPKRLLSLQEMLRQPKESKNVISFATTKKPPATDLLTRTLPSQLQKIKTPILSRGTLSDRATELRNLPSKDQKIAPTDTIYRKNPVTATPTSKFTLLNQRTQDLTSNSDIKSKSGLPQNLLNKSLLPNIVENTFLSKMKEAVLAKATKPVDKNSNNERNDVMPSASETMRATEPQKRNSFNCKMVCDKDK